MLALICLTGVGLVSCKEKVVLEELRIVAPETTDYLTGQTFTLDCVTVPEESAGKINLIWEISDENCLTEENGAFTACTEGTVKVTARVEGFDVSDEIELRVVLPETFIWYTDEHCQFAYPKSWQYSAVSVNNTRYRVWSAANGSASLGFVAGTVDELEDVTFVDDAASVADLSDAGEKFQAYLAGVYDLFGSDLHFAEPVRVEEETYLGVPRVQIHYRYTVAMNKDSADFHMTQVIFVDPDSNYVCQLSLSFNEKFFDETAQAWESAILSQFLPR